VDFVIEVQAPIRYATTFKKHVGNRRLQHMNSHDHHVMVQQIMIVGIHNLLQVGPHKTLICLGIMFQHICIKVVNQNEINVPHFCG
jgi:accessory gene regulator protein AgrB